MKPGITGLAGQQPATTSKDFEEVVRLDGKIHRQLALMGGYQILFGAVYVVFAGRGAEVKIK